MFAKALGGLIAALQYLPYILSAVRAVEDAHASMPGTAKKAVIMATVEAASKVGEQVPESHAATVSALIDGVVSVLNSSGVFKKSGPIGPTQ